MSWFKRLVQTPRQFHPMWIVLTASASVLIAGVIALPAVYEGSRTKAAPPAILTQEKRPSATTPLNPAKQAATVATGVVFSPPPADQIPAGPFGEMIKLGRDIFVDTQTFAKPYVGNGLNCVNCHLDDGRKANSAPLWGAYVKYPAYREKNQKVNSYEERLAGCFQFSMNGRAPAYDSKEMLALVAYSYWLAQGAPTGAELAGRGYPKLANPPSKPDASRGAAVFEANCALCHGADGQGTKAGDRYVFPPLWGKDSYNGGAGMQRVETAAAFIKANMPLGKPDSLTLQEAWDVAQFVDSHERPPDPRKKTAAVSTAGKG